MSCDHAPGRNRVTGPLLLTSAVLLVGACFFELGEVVPVGAGGGGAGANADGGGGHGGDAGSSVTNGGGGSGGVGGDGGGIPEDWVDPSYRHRIPLTVADDAPNLGEDDALVPLFLTPARFPYDAPDLQTDGSDLAVFDDAGAAIEFDVERWDAAGSLVWIRIPSLASGQRLWLYFGNPGATSLSDPNAVWSGYTAVYHLDDDLGATDVVLDSTVGGRHGAAANMDGDNVVSGAFAGAIAVDGAMDADQRIDVPTDPVFHVALDDAITVELWFRYVGDTGVMISYESCCSGWKVTLLSNSLIQQSQSSGFCGCQGQTQEYSFATGNVPGGNDDTWRHAIFIYDRINNVERFYIDDQFSKEETLLTGMTAVPGATLRLGDGFTGTDSTGVELDEVRIIHDVYTAAQITAGYRGGKDDLIAEWGDVESLAR